MALPYTHLKLLNAAIDATPLIDNHAHPLLTPETASKHPFLSIASEATGNALYDSKKSLSHLRAVKHLAGVLGCAQTWEAVEATAVKRRRPESREAWIRRCFDGIETILIDDGLDAQGQVEDYWWHSQFTRSECKRIVRIETVASEVIARFLIGHDGGANQNTLDEDDGDVVKAFMRLFLTEISQLAADCNVVAFKSIICYRYGLDILPLNGIESDVRKELEDIISEGVTPGSPVSGFSLRKRIAHPLLNSLIVRLAARAAQDSDKPIQFHTGLGDNDITLTRSSPSHLQSFIRENPKLKIVLLHAGYPWTRETAYLAATYPNVYADIGEVFPCISRQGQESVLREMLEVCPWSKILCSTDGHGFPEMYLIAGSQLRSVLKTVLGELVQSQQLDEKQAVQLVQDILFSNSKKLYKLETKSTLPNLSQLTTVSVPSTNWTNHAVIQKLQSLNAKYLRIYWHDYTSSNKCRLIPIKHVFKTLSSGKPLTLSLAKASFGMTQIDTLIPQASATGMYTARPDWSSLKPGPAEGHVSCYAYFTELDGSEAALCPRTILRKTVEKAAAEQGLEFLLGFEVEFLVLERNPAASATSLDRYQTLRSDGHSWSVSRAFADWGRAGSFSTAVDEILDALDAAGIDVDQFHAENAPGQFELVLSPLAPLAACDAVLHARQILESVAARHGFRATLHPKPFAAKCGSASHVHVSIASPGGDRPAVYEPFYAGVLAHFRAVFAFTNSNPTSYERMVDSAWAGGRWIAWGTQNKELPLRKIAGSHWEVKVLDGLANPYFAVAALLAAGMDGVRRKAPLTWKDCAGDPARFGAEERARLGIEEMFPADLREALQALREDESLGLDPTFVQRYVHVKEGELAILEPMTAEERRQWIMERY
ncbi:glutamine synthetase/guanido kinase [Daldinia caldariorum]|uniref:glutamine synthetase/guanido kinase n=1 Tax=Daldinia caldariorum TaxID=326644 RepID=UPI0020086E3D|nr:glutamine synthetase/guanido kinase [Daldinia caldariorum]KAI1466175.1 glutamine synthetase/guanido kinase [Daldinia caldariorum]